jgi:sec-independent protein translocase protein TatB
MFDVGFDELLVIVIVAIVVIGPKDLPMALRTAGRWIGKVRRVSGHFRSGIETMIREAELEEMERKWREQNEAIMASTSAHTPDSDAAAAAAASVGEVLPSPDKFAEPLPSDAAPKAEAAPVPSQAPAKQADISPELPLGGKP